jgi:Fe-S-cluster containining protein
LAHIPEPGANYCFECAKCCFTQPCALEPEDLTKIANYLDLTEKELFNRFLVLDYVEAEGTKQYYVCPARKTDVPGRIVNPDWTFSDSPCIFLHQRRCSIQDVKPKGGRTYYCGLLTDTRKNVVAYGKKRSTRDWGKASGLRKLARVAIENEQYGWFPRRG